MKKFIVIGNPIAQSKSPFIHEQFSKQFNIELEYQKALVEEDGFSSLINTFIQQGGVGANVTAPFKELAMQLCDQLSPVAKQAGSVNTLTFKNNEIWGDNTDGFGLVNDLLGQEVKLADANILVLGAGGATRGVILPLLEQKPKKLTIANRTVSKAELLASRYKGQHIEAKGLLELDGDSYDVIINATSASLTADIPNIPSTCIGANTVCYDMVYAKSATPFLLWAKEHGAGRCIDGLGMLVGQAAVSFKIWHNEMPDIRSVLTTLRTQL